MMRRWPISTVTKQRRECRSHKFPSDILLHLFNHQTHHRGQAHACLSILTGDEPPSLDLLVFQRGGTAPDLKTLIRQGRD
jgi:uncharacterized damage-inducible protein DinB